MSVLMTVETNGFSNSVFMRVIQEVQCKSLSTKCYKGQGEFYSAFVWFTGDVAYLKSDGEALWEAVRREVSKKILGTPVDSQGNGRGA